jgi:hypothetical protein
MPVTKTLILRRYAVKARILTIALDLQAMSVRESSQSRPPGPSIRFEYAVAGLK